MKFHIDTRATSRMGLIVGLSLLAPSIKANQGFPKPPPGSKIATLIQSVGMSLYPLDIDCTDGLVRPEYHFGNSLGRGDTLLFTSPWTKQGYGKVLGVLIAPPREPESETSECVNPDAADAPYRVVWVGSQVIQGIENWSVIRAQSEQETVPKFELPDLTVPLYFETLSGGETVLMLNGSSPGEGGQNSVMVVYRGDILQPLRWIVPYYLRGKQIGLRLRLEEIGAPVFFDSECSVLGRNRTGEIISVDESTTCFQDGVDDDDDPETPPVEQEFTHFPFVAEEGSFLQDEILADPAVIAFTMGVISDPYRLPRAPFDRVSGLVPVATENELLHDAEPPPDLDLICNEFQELGEFRFYIGSSESKFHSADTIDPDHIKAFLSYPAICPADQLTELMPAEVAVGQDFSGRWWYSEPCNDSLALPQVSASHPNRCEANIPDGGITVFGPYLIARIPACPILKRLLRQYQASVDGETLAIRVDGEAINGTSWQGYAQIKMVDGEWDSRFLPPSPPGAARRPAGSYATASCNQPAAQVPSWPWWRSRRPAQ